MLRLGLLLPLPLVLVVGGCSSSRCEPGNVPDDALQACVVPCDGGILNDHGECVSKETATAMIGGGAGGEDGDAAGGRTGGGSGDGGSGRGDRADMHGGAGGETAGSDAGISGNRAASPASGTGGAGGASGAGMGGSPSNPAGRSAGEAGHGGVGVDAGHGGAGMPAAVCGDGHPDPGELCDGNCPTHCDPGPACAPLTLSGSAAKCDAQCLPRMITQCGPGDGCCPSGCTNAMDSDCPVTCGDGVLDGRKKCDPKSPEMPCPTSCDDGDPCTTDKLVGSAAQCSAECVHATITAAISGDGCCPSGANANTDGDCPTRCGDGVVTGSETCDPQSSCPTSCEGSDACHPSSLEGSASTCDARCVSASITSCKNNDGCCAPGCTSVTDSDCTPRCGDGHRDPGESCDGDCVTSCDDGSPCTIDRIIGSAATCDATCAHASVEAGTSCGSNAVCNIAGDCLHNCQLGQPKCAGQPGTGSCVEGSTWMMCDGGNVCVATYIAAGATCGPGLTCDDKHNCK